MIVDRMDCHFRLNLKPLGKNRKGFNKSIAESPEPGHDILYLTAKQMVDASPDKTVPHIVEGPLIFLKIRGGKPVPYHHVRIMAKHLFHHLGSKLHRISVIPVHHDITPGINLPEHTPYHVPFALHIFRTHHCSFRLSDLGGAVR